MATDFEDIERAVRDDTGMSGSSEITSPAIFAYIRDAYHELLHGLPNLTVQLDPATGAITYLPEILTEDVTTLPDAMDIWVTHIKHYVKWRIFAHSRMDQAQAIRAKIELDNFQDVFRVSDIAR